MFEDLNRILTQRRLIHFVQSQQLGISLSQSSILNVFYPAQLLRHTEDILEMYVQEETLGQSIGRIYQKKVGGVY